MLVKKPPMGWNSWNTFGKDISEELIMQTADALVSTGLADAGYNYLNLDDTWSNRQGGDRGRIDGKLLAHPEKFPHGMKYLADYIHGKGLKFGIYSSSGRWTCMDFAASFNHEFTDAHTFADWDVDYLKYDFCGLIDGDEENMNYHRMSLALGTVERDILFAACNWGSYDVQNWIRGAGADAFRICGDITDNFQSVRNQSEGHFKYSNRAGVGCYIDFDMLVVGMDGKGNVSNGGCTDMEYKTHFAVWCMFANPLLIGGDIRNMRKEALDILKNRDLIAIDQDEECRNPFNIGGNPEKHQYALFRFLADNKFALMFLNYSDEEEMIDADLRLAGLAENSGYEMEMYDTYSHEPAGRKEGVFSRTLLPHESRVYTMKLVKKA